MNTPYFYLESDATLGVTVETSELGVCDRCPHYHVRIIEHATPTEIRMLADDLHVIADRLEGRRPQ